MARIVVLGADGMVGHISRIYLSGRGHEVFSVARTGGAEWDVLDVEDVPALTRYLESKKPDFVLNCIGVLIQESEADPERAIRLNALMPWILSREGSRLGYRLIHVSSDCVFSGENGPYGESDRRDADYVYGRTKALGEVVNGRDLTIRTSKVGPEIHTAGSGLFNWFMSQRGTVKGFKKAIWGGVTTLEMAKFVDFCAAKPITGLVHLTNGIPVSKYDLLRLFKEIWAADEVTIEANDGKASDRSLRCTREDVDYHVPGYREMLLELKVFMDEHADLYARYGH
jgi:dTDP-4-dehydrorhamnose reductase